MKIYLKLKDKIVKSVHFSPVGLDENDELVTIQMYEWDDESDHDYNSENFSNLVPEFCTLEGRLFMTMDSIDEAERTKALEDQWVILRSLRNILLQESDWTQLADVTLTEEEQTSWNTYRQELRDLPSTLFTPFVYEFPTKPS